MDYTDNFFIYMHGHLPLLNAVYAVLNNYYLLALMFLMQTLLGIDYLNSNTTLMTYIYAGYIILIVPYFIVVSSYTAYEIYY